MTENDGGAAGKQTGERTTASAHGRRVCEQEAAWSEPGAGHGERQSLLHQSAGLLHAVHHVPAADCGQECQTLAPTEATVQEQGAEKMTGNAARCQRPARSLTLTSSCRDLRPCHEPRLPLSAEASGRGRGRVRSLLSPFPLGSGVARHPEGQSGVRLEGQSSVSLEGQGGVSLEADSAHAADTVGENVRTRAGVAGTCAPCASVQVRLQLYALCLPPVQSPLSSEYCSGGGGKVRMLGGYPRV